MNNDHEYYIPENIEDEVLLSVAFMAKDILKENYILKDIMQKYIVAYNESSKESSSVSLEVMNQNYKLNFSTISSCGVKESPHISSFGSKTDACLIKDQLSTPLKKFFTGSSSERKQLTFDVEENEYMKSEHVITEYLHENDVHSDAMTPFSAYEESKLYDDPEETFSLDGIPYDQESINLSTGTPDKDQTMFLTPEKKNRSPDNYIIKQSIAPYLEYSTSHVSDEPSDSECLDTYENHDDEYYISEKFNLEGKPETITSLATYDQDDAYPLLKASDDLQIMTTITEEIDSTLAKYSIDDRDSISPTFLNPRKIAEALDKPNTNEQRSFCPDENQEYVSNQPVTHLETLCIPFKTPEKLQTFAGTANKEERTHINQIMVKKVALKYATCDKECPSPMEFVETSNSPKMKYLDDTEAMRSSCLISEYPDFMVPSKVSNISKVPATISVDSVMNSNDSVCSTDESPMDIKNSFQSADGNTMDCNDSFNQPDDCFTVDEHIAEFDKAIKSAFPVNNFPYVCVGLSKRSEMQTFQASTTRDCASPLSPEVDPKKMALEDESCIYNSKYDKIKTGAHEEKDESMKSLTKEICPSEKNVSVGTSMANLLVFDDLNLFGKLLQDNLSQKATPDQAEQFIELLKERKSRFSKYLHLFVEHQHDIIFIVNYIHKLAAVFEEILRTDNNEEVMQDFSDFASKGVKLLEKASSWHLDLFRDIQVWEDCIQKINDIQQDINQIYSENKQDMTPEDFRKWEAIFKIVNKKADDMTLVREVRRPEIIKFGCELESMIKSFLRSMLVKGLLKRCSRVY